MTTISAQKWQPRTILSENRCHFVNLLIFASSSFSRSMWLNSQQPKTRPNVEDPGLPPSIRSHLFLITLIMPLQCQSWRQIQARRQISSSLIWDQTFSPKHTRIHKGRMQDKEMTCRTQPRIEPHTKVFSYRAEAYLSATFGQKISDFFDLCLH